jgi:hypothetical protein
MNFETINVGTLPNDGSGDPLRVAYIKINNNFAIASNLTPSGSNGDLQFKLITTDGNITTESFSSSANLNYSEADGNLYIGSNIIPQTTGVMSIGDPVLQVGNIYLSQTGFNLGNINVTENANVLSFNVAIFPSFKSDIVVGGISYGNTNNTTINTTSFVTNTTSPIAIYAIPTSQFSAGKFELTSRENSSNNSQTVTIVASLNNDQNYISYAAHSTLFYGNAVTTYSMDVYNDNVRVIVTPFVSSTITHNISYQINT